MSYQSCPSCGTQVLATNQGACPNCGRAMTPDAAAAELSASEGHLQGEGAPEAAAPRETAGIGQATPSGNPPRRRRVRAMAAITGLAAFALLVWPTLYRYEEEVFAEVPADKWGADSVGLWYMITQDGLLKSRGWGNEPRLAVKVRVCVPRFSGKKTYEMWREKDNPGPRWLEVDTWHGGREFYAEKGWALDEKTMTIRTSLNMSKGLYKLIWPAAVREKVERGDFGAVRLGKVEQWWGGRDSVVLAITMEIQNTAVQDVEMPVGFYLADRNDVLLARFEPGAGSGATAKVPAKETVKIELKGVEMKLADAEAAQPMRVVNVYNGWRWKAPAIPSR